MKLKPEITKERVEKEVSQFFCMKSGCAFYTGSGKLRYVIEIYSTVSSLSPEGGYYS